MAQFTFRPAQARISHTRICVGAGIYMDFPRELCGGNFLQLLFPLGASERACFSGALYLHMHKCREREERESDGAIADVIGFVNQGASVCIY